MHVFSHRGHIGFVGYEFRAWRSAVGSHLAFRARLSLFGWQFRFEGNSTTDHPKFRRGVR